MTDLGNFQLQQPEFPKTLTREQILGLKKDGTPLFTPSFNFPNSILMKLKGHDLNYQDELQQNLRPGDYFRRQENQDLTPGMHMLKFNILPLFLLNDALKQFDSAKIVSTNHPTFHIFSKTAVNAGLSVTNRSLVGTKKGKQQVNIVTYSRLA